MEFTLIYHGLLPSSSESNTRPKVKQAIRREFSPQLADLWRQESVLSVMDLDKLQAGVLKGQRVIPAEGERFGADHYQVTVGGFRCIPLVTAHSKHVCHLDLTLFTRGSSQVIEQSGDLDNRIKVLFDALRIPQSVAELAGDKPAEPQERLFCLLEDDKTLIKKVTVEAKTLLGASSDDKAVMVYLNVTIKPASHAFKKERGPSNAWMFFT